MGEGVEGVLEVYSVLEEKEGRLHVPHLASFSTIKPHLMKLVVRTPDKVSQVLHVFDVLHLSHPQCNGGGLRISSKTEHMHTQC